MNTAWQWLNGHSVWMFLLGLALVGLWNGYRWQQDRALAVRLRAKQREPDEFKTTPKVSVLVAAWNEAEMIRDHVESFRRLSYPHKELILCAGGSDGTYGTARQLAGSQVTVLEQKPGEGKQRALQRALGRAAGDIVFLTDADCLLDDDCFTRTLEPLLLLGEDVATGTCRPLRRQLDEPFVVHQWCTDLYLDARRPKHISGILGRNCALKRRVLGQIGEFGAEVRTGTDYHAAKLLLAHGFRIRYVPDSAVETCYPERLRSYWRRQSRWIRNLMLHGPAFGAYDEVATALRTSMVGLTMLLLPLVSVAAGPIFLASWGVLLAHAFVARLRYARFAGLYQEVAVSLAQYLLTPVYVLVDFVAWTRPLVDLIARRQRW